MDKDENFTEEYEETPVFPYAEQIEMTFDLGLLGMVPGHFVWCIDATQKALLIESVNFKFGGLWFSASELFLRHPIGLQKVLLDNELMKIAKDDYARRYRKYKEAGGKMNVEIS